MKNIGNTKDYGEAHFIILREPARSTAKERYVAVCLDFDIIESGSNPIALTESILEAASEHLRIVQEQNLSDKLLNRKAPRKYWNMYYTGLADEIKNAHSSSREDRNELSVSGVFRIRNSELVAASVADTT